jgi:hypothetical protein
MCTAQTFRFIAANQRRLLRFPISPWKRERYLAAADKLDVLAQAKRSTEARENRSKEQRHRHPPALPRCEAAFCPGIRSRCAASIRPRRSIIASESNMPS